MNRGKFLNEWQVTDKLLSELFSNSYSTFYKSTQKISQKITNGMIMGERSDEITGEFQKFTNGYVGENSCVWWIGKSLKFLKHFMNDKWKFR